MTAGPRGLALLLQFWRAEHLARSCGVDPRTIRRWCDGKGAPDDRQRVVLAKSYGLPVSAWGQRTPPFPPRSVDARRSGSPTTAGASSAVGWWAS